MAWLLVATTLRGEMTDDYARAYRLIQEGDLAEKNGETAKTREKYTAALEILKAIQGSAPDWYQKLISFRIRYCEQHVARNSVGPPGEAVAARDLPTFEHDGQKIPIGPGREKTDEAIRKIDAGTQQRFGELFRENEALKGKLADTETTLTQSQTRLIALQNELSVRMGAYTDIESRLRKTEETLRATSSTSAERLRALTDENGSLKMEINEEGIALAKTLGQLTALQKEIDSQKQDRVQLEGRLRKAEADIAAQAADGGQQKDALLKETGDLKEKLALSITELKSLRVQADEVDALKNRLAATQAQLETLRQDAALREQARAEMEARLKKAEEDARLLAASGNEQAAPLSKENAALKGQLAEAATELRAAFTRLDQAEALKKQLAQIQAEYQALQNQKSGTDEAGADLRKRLQAAEEKLAETTARLTGAGGDEAATLKKQLARIQAEYDALRNAKGEPDEVRADLRRRLQAAEEKLAETTAQIKGSRAGGDEAEALKQQLAQVQSQYETLLKERGRELTQSEIGERLKTAEEKLRGVIAASQKEKETLVRENRILKNKFDSALAQYKEARDRSADLNDLKLQLSRAKAKIEAYEQGKGVRLPGAELAARAALEARLQKAEEELKNRAADDPQREALARENAALKQQLEESLAALKTNNPQAGAELAAYAALEARLQKAEEELKNRTAGLDDSQREALVKENAALKQQIEESLAGSKNPGIQPAEIESLKSQLAEAGTQAAALQKEVAARRQECAEMEAQLKEKETLSAQNALMRDKLVEATGKLKETYDRTVMSDALKADVARSHEELKQAQLKLTALTESYDDYRDAVFRESKGLREKLAQTTAQLKAARARLEEGGSSKADPTTSQEPLAALREKVAESERARAELQSQLQKSETELKTLVAKRSLEQESLARQNVMLRNRLAESVNVLKKSVSTSDGNASEVEALKADLARNQSQMKEVEDKLAAIVRDRDDRQNAVQAEAKVLRERLVQSAAELKAARAQLEDVSSLKTDLTTTQAQLAALQKNVAEREQARADLENQLRKSEAELKGLVALRTEERETLARQNALMRDKLVLATNKLKEIHGGAAEADSLKAELAKSQAQLEALLKDPNARDQVRNEVESDLKGRLQKAEDQVKTLVAAHAGEKAALADENIALKKNLASTAVDLKQILSRVAEVDSLKADLVQARTQVEALKNERVLHTTNTIQSEDLRSQLKKMEEELKLAKNLPNEQLAPLLKENNELKEQLRQLEADARKTGAGVEQVEKLRTELADAQTRLKTLESAPGTGGENTARLQDLESRLKKAQEDLAQATTSPDERWTALQKENGELKAQLQRLKTGSDSAGAGTDVIAALKDELAARQGEVQKLKDEAAMYAGAKGGLQDRLREATEALRKANIWNSDRIWKDERVQALLRENFALKEKVEKFEANPQKPAPPSVETPNSVAPPSTSGDPTPPAKPSGDARDAAPSTATPPAASGKETAPVPPPAPGRSKVAFSGRMMLINAQTKSALVGFDQERLPPPNSEWSVYRGDHRVGSLRIALPVNPSLATAEILTGTLERGDEVR